MASREKTTENGERNEDVGSNEGYMMLIISEKKWAGDEHIVYLEDVKMSVK